MNPQDAPPQQVLTLPGAIALSPFRVEKLLASLPKPLAEAITLDTRFVHFAAISEPLDAQETQVLEKLLTYGTPARGEPKGVLLLVIPRFGTVSPWSSKATDIAHNCGLPKVVRIERGVAYYISARDPGPLSERSRSALDRAIHDRMTETVVQDFAQAQRLFEHQAPQDRSLCQMIRYTHERTPRGTVVAYSDNSAVMEGAEIDRFFPDAHKEWSYYSDLTHILMKVETPNHPTAIAPHPGAGTGAGGEIRDEGATGTGGKPKAGLTGFSVSNLNIPHAGQPWEIAYGKPDRIVSALSIMIDGPIGGAAYNNEFGRPNLAGYFRTFELKAGG